MPTGDAGKPDLSYVVGIDLAASARSTAAIGLMPDDSGRWVATEIPDRLDDDALVDCVRGADVVGVDCPLGWPEGFAEALSAHRELRPWPGTIDRSSLRFRETDHATRAVLGRAPLSVSSDKLGVVAMRGALLQRRWGVEVWPGPERRDGSGRLVETYPAVAFSQWGIACRGYKGPATDRTASEVRQRMVEELEAATALWLDPVAIRERCIASDHVLDALACALVAIAASYSATIPPTEEQRRLASVEGWIHMPCTPLTDFMPALASPSRSGRR